MNATTMDAAAQTSAPSTEALKPAIRRLAQLVTDVWGGVSGLARWVWYFDLGAAVLVGEQAARFVGAAVEKGKEVEPNLTKPFRKAGDSVSGAIGEVGTRLKGIAKPVSTAGHPSGRSAHSRRDRATRTHPKSAH